MTAFYKRFEVKAQQKPDSSGREEKEDEDIGPPTVRPAGAVVPKRAWHMSDGDNGDDGEGAARLAAAGPAAARPAAPDLLPGPCHLWLESRCCSC